MLALTERRNAALALAAAAALAAACSRNPEPGKQTGQAPPVGPVHFLEESCCESDLPCQDGVWCTGTETCDCWGECGPGEPPCQHDPDPLDPCIEAGDCVNDRIDPAGTGYGMGHCEWRDVCIHCDDVGDCADGDLCTTEACVATVCTYTPVSCDDGNPCTADSCNSLTGCVNTLLPGCCDDDTDCNDPLFCNGVETCNELTGLCVPGSDPCAGGGGIVCATSATCNEA
jgi:hypothetical protein